MRKTALKYSMGLLGLACVSAMAIQITPTFDTFGTLSGATFGGQGIPNDAVAITTVTSGNYTITLGLTAHQRYSNPAPVNDGAGTFYAVAGGDVYSSPQQPGYARWNVAYYVDFDPNLSSWLPQGYSVRLYYDKDTAVGNDVTSYVTIEPNIFNGSTFDTQDSWNLGMAGGIGFDPNAYGEYSFALAVVKNNQILGMSAIVVNAGDGQIPAPPVPDVGATLALMGLSFAGLGGFARRRK